MASSAALRLGIRTFALALLVPALVSCDAGRVVEHKSVEPALEEGAQHYTIVIDGGLTVAGGVTTRLARPDDPWVRHCFDRAEVGSGPPYYCTAGRTPVEAWLGVLVAFVAAGVTWVVGLAVIARVPAPASVEAVGAGSSLFARQSAEKRRHEPIWREHWRLATSRYGLRAVAGGVLFGLLAALAAAFVLSASAARDWALVAGFAHIGVFALAYTWWGWRRNLADESTHARLLFGLAAGAGLFAGAALRAISG